MAPSQTKGTAGNLLLWTSIAVFVLSGIAFLNSRQEADGWRSNIRLLAKELGPTGEFRESARDMRVRASDADGRANASGIALALSAMMIGVGWSTNKIHGGILQNGKVRP